MEILESGPRAQMVLPNIYTSKVKVMRAMLDKRSSIVRTSMQNDRKGKNN